VRHFASEKFWATYEALPLQIRKLADSNYALLKNDPRHPSLQFKKVGRYWSVRVGLRYRALAVEVDDGYLRFWIGSHADYDRLIG
jgi:hypothetical protein